MTDETHEDQVREHQSKAIARAVAALHHKRGYAPELVFEGAIRGASALLIGAGVEPADVAKLLETSGRMIGTLDQDN